MKRAQIYLDESEYEAVRAEAFQRRSSISSLLRELIQENVLRKPKSKKRYAADLLDEIVGIVHETKTDVAERHDDYLWGDAE